MSIERTVVTGLSILPAACVGVVVSNLVGGGTFFVADTVLNATGCEPETADSAALTMGSVVGFVAGAVVTCKIVGAVYNAFEE